MIPLGDASRRPTHFPIVTIAIIAANALVFLLELTNGDDFVTRWSVIPVHIVAGQDYVTILTAMFMHAGWGHLIGNMVFLWAFGPEIEDAMSSWRFALFYLAGGVVAMLAQTLAMPTSTVPNLGASGAIAAVMGAFLVTYPSDAMRTVLFFGFFFRVTLIPAMLLIGIWLILQFLSLGTMFSAQGGGVAYLAHIGGGIFGALFGRLFEIKQRVGEGAIDDSQILQ